MLRALRGSWIATFTVLLSGAVASASPKENGQGSHYLEHLPGQCRWVSLFRPEAD